MNESERGVVLLGEYMVRKGRSTIATEYGGNRHRVLGGIDQEEKVVHHRK